MPGSTSFAPSPSRSAAAALSAAYFCLFASLRSSKRSSASFFLSASDPNRMSTLTFFSGRGGFTRFTTGSFDRFFFSFDRPASASARSLPARASLARFFSRADVSPCQSYVFHAGPAPPKLNSLPSFSNEGTDMNMSSSSAAGFVSRSRFSPAPGAWPLPDDAPAAEPFFFFPVIFGFIAGGEGATASWCAPPVRSSASLGNSAAADNVRRELLS